MTPRSTLLLLACALLIGEAFSGNRVQAQQITREQMQMLMPDENDLQGFVRLQLSKFAPSQDPTGADSDLVDLDKDVTEWMPGRPETPRRTGTVSRIRRNFASSDGQHTLSVEIRLCNTPADAHDEVVSSLGATQLSFRSGTLTGVPQIGDESWYGSTYALICRYGRIVVFVYSEPGQEGKLPFPPGAIEAVAYQVLLRASQEANLTGVSAHDARLAVNGKPLAGKVLVSGKQVYVPVAEFAKAMGYVTRWDAMAVQLALSGAAREPVTLTADTAKASVGGTSVALTTPVLKQKGQPVMTLQDLLTLVKGRITRQDGDDIQVAV